MDITENVATQDPWASLTLAEKEIILAALDEHGRGLVRESDDRSLTRAQRNELFDEGTTTRALGFRRDVRQGETREQRLTRMDRAAGMVAKGYSHTRDVLGFEHVQPRYCEVHVTDWPYDCVSKDMHPDHVVFQCVTHHVWWHRSPEELGLA